MKKTILFALLFAIVAQGAWALDPASITAAPSAIYDLVYKGSEQTLVAAGTAVGGTMNYSLNNTDWSTELPKATNAGTYSVYYKVIGDADHEDYTPTDNIIEVTIDKANPTYITRPSAIPHLIYDDGLSQTLVAAGTANAGTIEYKLGNGEWSTTVPKATAAGHYYVYYYIKGNENYNDVEPDVVIATIYASESTVIPDHNNYDANKITVLDAQQGANTVAEDLAYYLFDGNRDTKWCSIKWNTDAYSKRPKDIVVWKTEERVKMVSYTLITGNDTQTYPNRNWSSWTLYGGKFESDNDAKSALLTEDGWTVIDNQIQDTVLKAFNDSSFLFACDNPGWYKYYRLVIHDIKYVEGDKQDNIQQMAELTMGVLTGTPPAYETRPSARAYLQYTGANQTLITAGSVADDGAILYKLGNGEWSEALPQTDAIGNYYVYYKIKESELYPESEKETLIATIYGNRTVPAYENYPYGNISVLTKQEGSNTDGSQRANKLFNGDADSDNRFNKWCSVTTDIEKYEDRPKDIIVWKTNEPIEMIAYTLRVGNDAEQYPNRNWYSWTIYGGEFGSEYEAKQAILREDAWTIVDNQIKDTVLQEKNLERYDFACNNPGTYQYYRLVIHDLHVTKPTENQGVQQMAELTMGVEPHSPTDIEETNANANAKAAKFLYNGILYIERDGKIYNAQGAQVK